MKTACSTIAIICLLSSIVLCEHVCFFCAFFDVLLVLFCDHALINYSMEQSPSWEVNWFSDSQEIPHILWNLKVHNRIHKCPPPVVSWASSIQSIPPHCSSLKNHLNIILPFMPGSPKWPLSLRLCHQNPVYTSPLSRTHYMPRPSHSSQILSPKPYWVRSTVH